jgi:hypothetical protein
MQKGAVQASGRRRLGAGLGRKGHVGTGVARGEEPRRRQRGATGGPVRDMRRGGREDVVKARVRGPVQRRSWWLRLHGGNPGGKHGGGRPSCWTVRAVRRQVADLRRRQLGMHLSAHGVVGERGQEQKREIRTEAVVVVTVMSKARKCERDSELYKGSWCNCGVRERWCCGLGLTSWARGKPGRCTVFGRLLSWLAAAHPSRLVGWLQHCGVGGSGCQCLQVLCTCTKRQRFRKSTVST